MPFFYTNLHPPKKNSDSWMPKKLVRSKKAASLTCVWGTGSLENPPSQGAVWYHYCAQRLVLRGGTQLNEILWPCISEHQIGSQTYGFLKIHFKKKRASTNTTDLERLSLKGPISQYLNIEYQKTHYPNMTTSKLSKLRCRFECQNLGHF